jgi:hypothetical protein
MDNKSNYGGLVQVTEEDVQRVSLRYSDDHHGVWDPAGLFDFESVVKNSSVIIAKYEKLKSDPGLPARQKKKRLIISGILMGLTLPILLLDLFAFVVFLIIMGIVVLIIYATFTKFYKSLCYDLIKILMALAKRWFYDPFPSAEKWMALRNLYPEIFNRGNAHQNVEDQFWGKFRAGDRDFDFYAGLFHYARVTKDSKGKSHRRDYEKNFFCLRPGKSFGIRFFLFTHKTGASSSEIDSRAVKSNSAEFDRNFNISTSPEPDAAENIVRGFPSDVLSKLNGMFQTKGPFGMLVTENCVFYVFDGPFLPRIKSDLIKSIEMDPEDMGYFDREFSMLTGLTSDIIRSLHL